MSKYVQIRDDEEITLPLVDAYVEGLRGAGLNLSCCDCGLVHQVIFIPLENNLKIYMKRDNRRTANHRRRKKLFRYVRRR